jgi:hypothetical protein
MKTGAVAMRGKGAEGISIEINEDEGKYRFVAISAPPELMLKAVVNS